MLEIGPARYPDIDFRLDDCSQHQTVDDGYIKFGWNRQRLPPSAEAKRRGYFHFFTSLLIPLDITSVLFIETRAKDNWCKG